MTALNILKAADALYVFTDGAMVAPDGSFPAVGGKAIILPHLRTVLAARGGAWVSDCLHWCFRDGYTRFDDIREHAEADVRAYQAHQRQYGDQGFGWGFEMYFAGWSESRDAPVAFMLVGDDDTEWRLVEITTHNVAPYDDELGDRLRAAGVHLDRPLQPIETGLKIMRLQREMRRPLRPGGPKARGAGGFCQMTIVTRDAILSKVIERWPDDCPAHSQPQYLAR